MRQKLLRADEVLVEDLDIGCRQAYTNQIRYLGSSAPFVIVLFSLTQGKQILRIDTWES
jgi:hypothetical protein